LWLSVYAVVAAATSASRNVAQGIASAITGGYGDGAGVLFWIGFIVIVTVALQKRLATEESRGPLLAGTLTMGLVGLAVCYAWGYYTGYLAFLDHAYGMKTALLGVYDYATTDDATLMSLNPDARRVRRNAEVLERRGLGPFSPRMRSRRRELESSIKFATNITSGEGFIDVIQCSIIAGWVWDPKQPDTPVKVDIYDGNILLGTTPASHFRQDLRDAGKGNGRHSFQYNPPPQVKDGGIHIVRAVISGTRIELGQSRQIACPK
jgi:hypothetical protein